MKIVESEIVEIGVEEGVDPGFRIKELCFFQFGVTRGGGDSSIVQCCVRGRQHCYRKFYMGQLPMKTKFNVNIDFTMSPTWTWVR